MHLLVCRSTYVAVVRGHLLVPCAILCVRGSLARIFARSMKSCNHHNSSQFTAIHSKGRMNEVDWRFDSVTPRLPAVEVRTDGRLGRDNIMTRLRNYTWQLHVAIILLASWGLEYDRYSTNHAAKTWFCIDHLRLVTGDFSSVRDRCFAIIGWSTYFLNSKMESELAVEICRICCWSM